MAPASGAVATAPPAVDVGQVIVGLGAVIVVVSMFLNWIDFTVSAAGRTAHETVTASGVQVQFLFDWTNTSNDPSILVVLIPAVLLGVLGAILHNKVLAIIGAIVSLFVAAMFTFQLDQTLDRVNELARGVVHVDLGDLLGIAPFVCGGGAIVMLVGGLLLRRR